MIKVIRSSKLHMAMSCAGSQFFTDLPDQPMNDAAMEGTAAAEYLERLLTNQPIGTHAANGVPFTEEMEFYLSDVAREIRSKAKGEINCETQVDWHSLPSNIKMQGRLDVSFFGADGRLYVDDLKYGYGLVEVKENWQLLCYAIGVIIKLGKACDVVLRIHQPRAHHEDGATREWIVDYNTLLQYKDMIDKRMTELSEGYNTLQTGPQCKYCPAAAHCPAHNKAYHRGLEVVNNFVQDTLSDGELAHQLDLINRMEEIVKTRKGSLELLATSRIATGQIIPGYVTVDNYGHRKWNDDVTPDAIKMLTGIDITEPKLVTPAQAERRGFNKKLTEMFTTRPHLGTKLKRDSKKEGDKIFGNKQPLKEIN